MGPGNADVLEAQLCPGGSHNVVGEDSLMKTVEGAEGCARGGRIFLVGTKEEHLISLMEW